MSKVRLLVSGNEYAGWTSVRVNRSMDQVCGTFNLTLSERWDGPDAPPQIHAGDACAIYFDDDLVLTGYIDDALPSYDDKTHTISISGRSSAADLVDCGLPPQQFLQPRTLTQLAESVCKGFGIKVRADVDVGAPFPSTAIEAGQTGFEFLEKLARQRGVRLMSDADGTLVIGRSSKTELPVTLELGVNIRAASGRFSQRDRFNQIVVTGQTPGSNNWNGLSAAVNVGSATDSDIRKDRRHYIVAENTADIATCKRRAEWQRNTAYGRGQALTYTVSDWRHAGGLWVPNVLVPVIDKWMRLDNEKRLIASVQCVLDENGASTELQLMPPEAFDLVSLPAKGALSQWN